MAVSLALLFPKTTSSKAVVNSNKSFGTATTLRSHRRTNSSSTDAASDSTAAMSGSQTQTQEERGAFPFHRRINSGPKPSLSSAAPQPLTRAASGGSGHPLRDPVDLPPKPRKSSGRSVGSEKSHRAQASSTSVGSTGGSSSSVGFVSTPTGASVSSVASPGQSLTSLNSEDNKKGKRKKREYARDERWAGIRRVVDALNKAIGPEKRRQALSSALIEFSHNSAPKHTASLYLGAADALTVLLSMSEDEEEISIIASALEMVYRGEKEGIIYSYREVGAALVPLCLRLLERAERRGKPMEGTICDISKVLLYMTRISELRTSLVGHPGMLAALERVGNCPAVENRVLRMRILANLANSENNKTVIFERQTLLESVMKVATLDKSDSCREYASAVLMDLASCPANQVAMARIDKVLATFVKLAIVEDKSETREYAVSGLQNLAFEKRNRVQLVTYRKGVVVEALKKAISSDSNEKTRRRSAGALTNLACDDTAEKMGCHDGLLKTLSKVSVADSNKDVQQRATLALTKLANSVTIDMSCWSLLLDALIDASKCPVADGIVSAMFRVKARSEENRVSMAQHPRLLETMSRLCLSSEGAGETPETIKDCENATKAIAHLANEPNNHKIICNKHILAALVYGSSLPSPHAVTRDAAILAMERMAMEHSNRPMMARYPGMLVSIAQATEREMKEAASGMSVVSGTGQPRLAKPLLMSLLVAM